MTNLHAAIPAEQLTEAYRLLLEMRDNCVKHEDDQYDDPKREAKYEALNIAITAMGRSIPPRWISVEERLPEPLTDVVVIVRHGDGWQYTIGYVLNEEWHRTGGSRNFYYGGKITHWMPLPEPPKEET